MKTILLFIVVFSSYTVANDFNIDSAFGLHKGMTKIDLDKIVTDFKKLPDEPNFYCMDYNSTYVPIKSDFDYYVYTFYKDHQLIGITGVKKNASNDFFTKLFTMVKDKYGQETNTNKDHPLETYYFYYWDIKNDDIESISINNFFSRTPNKVKLSYFFIPTKTCLKK